MIKENQLQGLKRLESFIKGSIPRYNTRLHQGKLYVETIFRYLQVECSKTTKGVSYLILDIYGEENNDGVLSRAFVLALIDDFDKEDQLRKFFKDLYDEEIILEDYQEQDEFNKTRDENEFVVNIW